MISSKQYVLASGKVAAVSDEIMNATYTGLN